MPGLQRAAGAEEAQGGLPAREPRWPGCCWSALTLITIAFIFLAPVIIPLFTGDEFTPALDALCVGLSQVLFPIVVLLGLTGLAVGILNVHDHFTIPAIAPLVWNVVIIAGMVGLAPLFEGDDKLYAYAIGVVAGTLVQLLMMIPALRRIGFPVASIRLPRRGDVRVKRVLLLMLPVSRRPRADQHQPAAELDDRLAGLRPRCRERSTPPSASTCSRRGCSASRWRPSCSRSSRGSPRARTTRACRRRSASACARSRCC